MGIFLPYRAATAALPALRDISSVLLLYNLNIVFSWADDLEEKAKKCFNRTEIKHGCVFT